MAKAIEAGKLTGEVSGPSNGTPNNPAKAEWSHCDFIQRDLEKFVREHFDKAYSKPAEASRHKRVTPLNCGSGGQVLFSSQQLTLPCVYYPRSLIYGASQFLDAIGCCLSTGSHSTVAALEATSQKWSGHARVVLTLVYIALLSGEHILLEDVPGVGQGHWLAKAFAKASTRSLPEFNSRPISCQVTSPAAIFSISETPRLFSIKAGFQ